jgi:hypothetical protein
MMYAGDPSVYEEVQRRVIEDLFGGNGEDSAPTVVEACERAYRAELERHIDGKILSRYGLTRKEFVRDGRAYFGEEQFARIRLEVDEADLNTTLLVMGFDLKARPWMFTVSNPGVRKHRLALGFHAIGTGDLLALGTLAQTYDVDLDTDELMYRVCEAKFASELATAVGKKTYAMKLAPDGTQHRLPPERIKPLGERWHRKRPPVPRSTLNAVRQNWREFRWRFSPPPADPMRPLLRQLQEAPRRRARSKGGS